MKKIFFLLFILHYVLLSFSQADSCHLRISLLTCGPGKDLYSIWGHTGIRVTDTSRQVDVVFNYGTFDDSDPLFYIKFTKGIMLYSVTPFSFTDFMEEYTIGKRSVTEQVLNLSCAEKIKLMAALWKNAEKENSFYPYHFYADNCTTRAGDIVSNNVSSPIQFKNIRPRPGSTYRQLIHSYMNGSTQAWNRFGIDILLGNHLDEVMSIRQTMFLPDYLMKGFDSAVLNQHPLVAETHLLTRDGQENDSAFFTPMLLFSLLLVIMIVLSVLKNKTAGKIAGLFDRVIFLLTGLLGIVMVVLWLIRVDTVCRNNYNLLWAFPTHAIIAFVIHQQKKWVKSYLLLTTAICAFLLITWKWLPQEMNNALLPLIALLLIRSFVCYKK